MPQRQLNAPRHCYGYRIPCAYFFSFRELSRNSACRRVDRVVFDELVVAPVTITPTKPLTPTHVDWLARTRPEVTVHRVDCRGRTAAEVTEAVRAAVTPEGDEEHDADFHRGPGPHGALSASGG
ncbi:hypothetical protein ACFY64_40330 [Streptomyces collinus]|uniref:hypothetical protein n=1 Tax=Streptomyces collinus TaxID=42684 RepID=UPI0036C71FFF